MKRILIAGAGSYIGDCFKTYMDRYGDAYEITVGETKDPEFLKTDFSKYDAVFCVAGIAHIKETEENRPLYYRVNRDLVIELARAAKQAGVRQFVLLSSMSVYGMTVGHITKDTPPHPVNAYGDSKLQADRAIETLADENFIFTCLRPPMVYGKHCRGNYQTLRNFALRSPVFPDYDNQRSMIYIGNLCAFVKKCIDEEAGGLFFPQNAEYVRTSDMVKRIAEENGKTIRLVKLFNGILSVLPLNVVKKVFGSLTYEKCDTVSEFSFEESMKETERSGEA